MSHLNTPALHVTPLDLDGKTRYMLTGMTRNGNTWPLQFNITEPIEAIEALSYHAKIGFTNLVLERQDA